jgi:hypothetical protein
VAYGAPCRIVKHISDSADETALEWPQRIDNSARVLGNWLEAFISAG